MEQQSLINKRFVVNFIVASFFLLLLYGFLKLISPFVISIFFAVIFSIIYYPSFSFLEKKFNRNISSFLTILFMFLTFIVPSSFFGWLLFKEARNIYPQLIDYLNSHDFSSINFKLPDFIISRFDIKEIIISNIENIQNIIVKFGISILRNIFMFFINFIVMMICVFFLLRDGKRLLNWVVDILPFDNTHIEYACSSFSRTTKSIVIGVILTAFIQGIVATVGYYVIGITSPVLFGFFVFFSALVPFVGTSLVTFPLTIYYYLKGDMLIAIFVFLWGFFVVGLIDNLIRPIFIGKNAKLPISLVFLGLIAGIKTYGPPGLFIGPIFVSVIITVFEIYKSNIRK